MLAASLLAQESVRLPPAAEPLQSCCSQLEALAEMHRQLSCSEIPGMVLMRPFLQEFCQRLRESLGKRAGSLMEWE
jgi:hypothetical protein